MRLWSQCQLGLLSPEGSASKMACSHGGQVGSVIGGGLTFSPREPARLLNVLTTRPQLPPE